MCLQAVSAFTLAIEGDHVFSRVTGNSVDPRFLLNRSVEEISETETEMETRGPFRVFRSHIGCTVVHIGGEREEYTAMRCSFQ